MSFYRRGNAVCGESRTYGVDWGKVEIISNSYLSVSINPDFIETVNYVTNFQREMRKVEAMTVLATQSPQEMVPENMSSDNFSKLKKVFEFSSTKIFMRMDESILRHIEGLVGKSMTNSELESIPQQNQGDAVINFGSKETIRVHLVEQTSIKIV